jgi:hypothetical protein
LRFGALALRQQDVAAPVVGQGDELGPAGDGVDLLERFLVLLRVEQEAGEAQAAIARYSSSLALSATQPRLALAASYWPFSARRGRRPGRPAA